MVIFFTLILAVLLFSLRYKSTVSLADSLSREHSDTVKGLFILLVFFSHSVGYVLKSGVVPRSVDSMVIGFVHHDIGQLMVVMFLFYSGYGIHENIKKKSEDYIENIPVKRIFTTLYNFDIAVLVFACFSFFYFRQAPSSVTILKSLIGWESLGNSNWYIFDILCLYTVTYFVYSLKLKENHKLFLSLIAVCIGAVILSRYKQTYWYDTVLAYPLGLIVSQYRGKLETFLSNHGRYWVTFLSLLFLFFFLSSSFFQEVILCHPSLPWGWGGYCSLRALVFCCVSLVFLCRIHLSNAFFLWCGRRLFVIYIYQRLFMMLYPRQWIPFSPFLFLFITLWGTLVLAKLYYRTVAFIEQKYDKLYKHCVDFYFKYIVPSVNRNRYVLFESYPTYSDSVKLVFDEFVKRGYNTRYKLAWGTTEKISYRHIHDKYPIVNFIKSPLKWRYFTSCSVVSISSNMFISSPQRENIISNFYIMHGTHIKSTKNYYVLPENIEKMICASEAVKGVEATEMRCPEEKVIGLGLPRNDELLKNHVDISGIIGKHFKKVVVWYPTFRQHKKYHDDSRVITASCLPLMHDQPSAENINEYAKQKDILIIIKPHFAQDLSYIKCMKLSNILFINDDFYRKHHISSYQFVGSCDALITDYSSVMYDYTLCDKPIALIWEDVEDYRKNPGFADGIDTFLECAHKVYNDVELFKFLDIVAEGIDPLEEKRKQIKALVNCSVEADNTSRVTDYIIREARI